MTAGRCARYSEVVISPAFLQSCAAMVARLLPYTAAVIAVLSFVGFIHFHATQVPPEKQLLGLLDMDTLVYYACAREWWENGKGLFYPSPYSAEKDTPAIYSHLGFLLAALVWHGADLSLYAVDQGIRLLFGISMLVLAAWTFRTLLPRRSACHFLSVTAAVVLVCGGGLAWLLALLGGVQNTLILWHNNELEKPPLQYLLSDFPEAFVAAEKGYGDWGGSLVRILPLSFECFYHTLFFATFLLVAFRRYACAAAGLFLTWWAHPFTGIEAGFILSTFLTAEVLLQRGRKSRLLVAWGLSVLINAVFLGYYGVYLPRFPEHVSVEEQMRRFSSTMQPHLFLPAYGAFAFLLLPALYLGWKQRWYRRPADRLMWIWTACVLFLVFHDRVLPVSFQPMHFTRGYLYYPLVYFATRVLITWSARPIPALSRKRSLVAVVLLLVHVPDTACLFLSTYPKVNIYAQQFWMSRKAASSVEALKQLPSELTIVPGVRSSLPAELVPLLTHHRTLMGHMYNTAFSHTKTTDATLISQEFSVSLMRKWDVDAVLVTRTDLPQVEATGELMTKRLAEDLFLAQLQSTGSSTGPSGGTR